MALFLSASGIWINLRTALKSLCRGTTVCVAVGCGGESAGERKKEMGASKSISVQKSHSPPKEKL